MARLRPYTRAAEPTDPGHSPDGPRLLATLRESLADYRDVLPAPRRADCASSLIHMHANRLLPSADDEPLVRALAADLIARQP